MTPLDHFGMIIIVIILIVLFLRKGLLWFFKIDKRLEVSEQILNELKRIDNGKG